MYAFWKILILTVGVLSVHLSIVYFKLKDRDNGKMKLVIDTDAGGDDAVAILLALAALPEDMQVIAVTCVYGNTDLDNVEKNVLKILTVAERSDIPVYSGANKPLVQNYIPSDYFGKDGLGDFKFDKKITISVDRSKHAAQAMAELAQQHSGNISILTLGPLTNVALAASLDPNFTRNVHRFYVMGSTKHPETEFNFSQDPESVAIFLNSSTRNKTLVSPYEVVEKNKISKDWRTKTLGGSNSEVMKFLNKVENVVLENSTHWYAADSIAVATMLWPDLVTSSSNVLMSPVVEGPHKGSVILKSDDSVDEKNVEVVNDLNLNAFKDKLLKYLN